MTDSYEVYAPEADAEPAARPRPAAGSGAAGPWQVVVEYSNKGEAKPSTIVRVIGDRHEDRDAALAEAEREAFAFKPPDPYSPQSRTVYRDGPDGFLVVIQGLTKDFHMSVRVVQKLGVA